MHTPEETIALGEDEDGGGRMAADVADADRVTFAQFTRFLMELCKVGATVR
jgi:hypothetical protein